MNLKTDGTNSNWVEPACNDLLFFSFQATENLHIDKAINSPNKDTPVHAAKVSTRFHGEHVARCVLLHGGIFL